MRVYKNLFGGDGKDKIHPNEIAMVNEDIGLNSGDIAWHDIEGFRVFFFGSAATSRGYPQDYGMLIHIKSSGTTIFQLYLGSSNNLWKRRASLGQSLNWHKM